MRFNTVGKTGIRLSVVGFGTAQLRMVPEKQAIDTLCRGFELGVNWVHTATDYGGAEVLVAKAIAESGRTDIQVVSNAPGPIDQYRWAFENTCRVLGTDRLPLFGISGIDYCEDLGHNIWERGGLIEFLREMKRQNRLGGIYCSTHGSPDYIAKLITSGAFDALMISYNPLGFHVLSYYGKAEGKEYEDIGKNFERIFPLARKHGVSLLIMKPLAGGLLCRSKAFPSYERFSNEGRELSAGEVLKAILQHPEICAVAPGTASVDEAEENALAGHSDADVPHEVIETVDLSAAQMRASLCSRCGACEERCSRSLRISWLFREGYIWNYPSDTFEALGRLHYFKLHPWEELACTSCEERTCICPSGVDIPASLGRVHARMLALRSGKLMHSTPEELDRAVIAGEIAARVVCREIPDRLEPGQKALARFWIENPGPAEWLSFHMRPDAENSIVFVAEMKRREIVRLPLMHDMPPGQRTHFAFEFNAPATPGCYKMKFFLRTTTRRNMLGKGTELPAETLSVEGRDGSKTNLYEVLRSGILKLKSWGDLSK